jgi:hypothetical protein
MTTEGGARAAYSLIQLSNNPRFCARHFSIHTGVIHRPLSFGAGPAPLSFPFPSQSEGAERRDGAPWWAPLREVPAGLAIGPLALSALHRGDFLRYRRARPVGPGGLEPSSAIQAALPQPFIRPPLALAGVPLIGDGRWHRTLGRDHDSRLQAPLPAPPNRRL